MLKLLQFLWTGCWHEWAIKQEGPYQKTLHGKVMQEGIYTDYQCKKCGRLKTETTI